MQKPALPSTASSTRGDPSLVGALTQEHNAHIAIATMATGTIAATIAIIAATGITVASPNSRSPTPLAPT